MTLAAGATLGPYEVIELLGAGGMGEVYRARDPRLDREVAVKVLPAGVAGDSGRLALFEREARAVAALNHPNILTVHDVGTDEGTPYVVTELLEGENLRELVSRRTPTVSQILGYALQAARGLEAAHAKGLVHRDLKPENLFLTTDGRVKVLDFGLAKLVRSDVDVRTDVSTAARTTPPGQVVGTVLYMSPEQARAQPLDVRSDVFSFGVVLYELLARKHPFRRDTAVGTLTAIVEETPAGLESLGRGIPPAVGGIVRRCLEKAKEDRYPSGHETAVALEAVLAAPSDSAALQEVEERSPYPGLSSFTEKDAGVFFGREREVEELWGRIRSRRLLAVIGPSGVGKTSFVRAGVVADRPEGWTAVVATPGEAPMTGLARALVPQVAGDEEAVEQLLHFEDPEVALRALGRWRRAHGEALLVVDQFEELFTLNPPEVQERFTTLLERLGREADLHVLLSLRDDFLMRCHDQKALLPVFSELTPLGALDAEGLERALVEPARKRGYAFDDETLVGEMVSAVEGARGALPLLAFAVARLWEKRDREKKLLTRRAYEEISGVEGALAQHAEATMDRIGPEHQGLVREIFRNLVTAQGTRAVIDREELLSAFPESEAAGEVLDRLIDARLLTAYEVEGREGEPSHSRIEVVHESLLRAWPRLVRWQSQDQDGAQLRDQLRQAARLWDEKNRTPDLLWSGTALQEFELWQGRYAGKLTALEEEFSRSMVDRGRRRRRVRRGVVTAAFLVLTAFATAITVSRQEAMKSRDEARAETRRAEASKLLTLAQARLADDPTEALAYTMASIEVSDSREARVFAMKTLWEAPPALEMVSGGGSVPAFSPDGRWLALTGLTEKAHVWVESGEKIAELPGHPTIPSPNVPSWSRADSLVTGNQLLGQVHVWSIPTGEKIRSLDLGGSSNWRATPDELLSMTLEDQDARIGLLRSWPLPHGDPRELGRVDLAALGVSGMGAIAPNGSGWVYTKGRDVRLRPLPVQSGTEDILLTRHETEVPILGGGVGMGDLLYSRDPAGEIRTITFSDSGPPRVVRIPKPDAAPAWRVPEPSGRWLIQNTGEEHKGELWSRTSWPEARPLELRRRTSWYAAFARFHPTGDWVVASTGGLENLTFWPLRRPYPAVVPGYTPLHHPLRFSPDSRWLLSSWETTETRLRLWPVGRDMSASPADLELPEEQLWTNFAFDPLRRYVFVVGTDDRGYVVPLDGSPARRLDRFSDDTMLKAAAVSPSGRQVATAFVYGGGEKTLRVWDLEADELRLFDLPGGPGSPDQDGSSWEGNTGYERGVFSAVFVDESTLYTAGDGGIRRWDLTEGTHDLVYAAKPGHAVMMRLGGEGRTAIVHQGPLADECLPLEIVDVRSGRGRSLPEFGDCGHFRALALDPSGTVAATGGARDGLVRVGRLDGGEPHILAGHEGTVDSVAISPDLRWVASAGEDNTLRLWPMPDLDAPPLHTLPREELLAKLQSLTNFRAVRDPEAPNGWRIDLDPFPGWKDVPTW
jgi:WD40 repeat protein